MNPYRQLPSVNQLISRFPNGDISHTRLVNACRKALDTARAIIQESGIAPPEDDILQLVQRELKEREQLSLRPVINATGVIIHTNLGRAPLSTEALQAMHEVAIGYSTLEYELEAGQRGKRDTHIEAMVREVTGAEAALVVNNNASAVYLSLAGLAAGREVIVSRGELVEIGGGFRMPDVMAQSGCHLVEVGTTNRTRAGDYANAITENTALLMRIHSSNFKQIGFTENPALNELAALAHQHNVYLMDDLGSGALLDTSVYGLEHEPTVGDSLAAGVDLITFSGDKLLGGPQAGLIVGRQVLIDKLKKHPLARAVRPDKLCLAGLLVTLKHYRDGEALEKVPVWRMIALPTEQIEARAQHWQQQLGGEVIDAFSTVGGGSLPGTQLPSRVLALSANDVDYLADALRRTSPPIIGRIQDGRLLLDPRTVLPEQDEQLLQHLHFVIHQQ
jgi:L-seryl-tRNA(Ser) seleniumtransferase